ncbi:hypothetical protein O1611_g930 [Lasiodiplodia mahajangana]|uniref:Uncharacterized protein n=1 Tax=Lasiodiplodia mahajangana TaxID=1108764 RepID=A0ACC2JYX7_9PEZI|nr:hypothetical protein O1611_g930 [Lasiodiplodia mahajangana]
MHFSSTVVLSFLGFSSRGLAATVHSRGESLPSILRNPGNHWSSQTTLSFPGDARFENVTERWTIYEPPTFNAAVSPATENDVVEAVKLARAYNLSFLATGGRHGYGTTLGNLHGGLSIDLSQMNSVKVDKRAGLLTVGPGVRFRNIVGPVEDAGFEIQTGTCSCPGMIGVTIGAGIGRLAGVHGLLIDALVSARVVTADGRVLEVSAKSNPDLFWGIRGAGANFGIITSATYKLHPRIDYYTAFDFVFPASTNATYFNTIQKLIHGHKGPATMPEKLASSTSVVYNATTNQPQLIASWVYAGPQHEAMQVMAPILAIKADRTVISRLPWSRLNTETGFGSDASVCLPEKLLDIYTTNVRKFDAPTYTSVFQKFADFYQKYPDARGSSFLVEAFPNQATTAVPDSATAYPWRDSVTYLLLQFTWGTGSASEAQANAFGQELRRELVATSGFNDVVAYVNYAHGDEKIEQIYGKNKLPRLASLKAKYDPQNVFAFNNALPSKYP